MAEVQASEIITYGAATTADGDANGGRMNHLAELPTNQVGTLFPDILESQRLDGRFGQNAFAQKVFRAIRNPDNKTYANGVLYLGYPFETPGYTLELVPATHTGVWGDVKANRRYGIGRLSAIPTYNSGTGKTTITIETAGSSFAHFQAGDTVAITDQIDTTDATGHVEFLPVENATYTGTSCELICTGALRYTYATSRLSGGVTINTRVASVAEYGDVKCAYSVSNNTSAHGTTDVAEILPRNVGAKHQTLTLTFDSATTFQAVSNLADVETVVSGSINATWSPTDTNGNEMISVPAAFWTGNWASGDSVQIHIEPAGMPVFLVIQCASVSASFAQERVRLWSSGNSSTA